MIVEITLLLQERLGRCGWPLTFILDIVTRKSPSQLAVRCRNPMIKHPCLSPVDRCEIDGCDFTLYPMQWFGRVVILGGTSFMDHLELDTVCVFETEGRPACPFLIWNLCLDDKPDWISEPTASATRECAAVAGPTPVPVVAAGVRVRGGIGIGIGATCMCMCRCCFSRRLLACSCVPRLLQDSLECRKV